MLVWPTGVKLATLHKQLTVIYIKKKSVYIFLAAYLLGLHKSKTLMKSNIKMHIFTLKRSNKRWFGLPKKKKKKIR